MTLAYKIMLHGTSPPEWASTEDYDPRATGLALRLMPIIDVSAACDLVFSGTAQEVFDIERDFPNLMPRRSSLWLEMAAPKIILSEAHGHLAVIRGVGVSSWGVQVHACDAATFTSRDAPTSALEAMFVDLVRKAGRNAHAVVSTTLFTEESDGTVRGPMAFWMYVVDKDGAVLSNRSGAMAVPGCPTPTPDALGRMTPFFYPAFMAISFMNRPGTRVLHVQPTTDALLKAHRRGLTPPPRHGLLSIAPKGEASA